MGSVVGCKSQRHTCNCSCYCTVFLQPNTKFDTKALKTKHISWTKIVLVMGRKFTTGLNALKSDKIIETWEYQLLFITCREWSFSYIVLKTWKSNGRSGADLSMFRFNLPNEPSVIKTGIKKLNRANEISLHSRLDITAYLNAKSRKLGEIWKGKMF